MDVTVAGLTASQLATLQQWATDTPRVSAMTVFGSRARGTHHPASDVDIAIDLIEASDDTAGWLWIDRREAWNAELSALVGLDVRLVRLTDDDDGGIGQGLSDDGITVFRI
jgi:predicted nucleotidyltransferase